MTRPRRRRGAQTERILALDTSSTTIGWAVFDNERLVVHGRNRMGSGGHCEKLATFREWLRAMVHEHKPDQVLYEKPFPGRRRFAFGVLNLYVAVVMLVQWEVFGAELPEGNAVPAREVKRRLKMKKGKDHEGNKKIAVLLANRLYGINLKFKSNDKTKKVSQDDQADAILLGRAWMLAERPWLLDVED